MSTARQATLKALIIMCGFALAMLVGFAVSSFRGAPGTDPATVAGTATGASGGSNTSGAGGERGASGTGGAITLVDGSAQAPLIDLTTGATLLPVDDANAATTNPMTVTPVPTPAPVGAVTLDDANATYTAASPAALAALEAAPNRPDAPGDAGLVATTPTSTVGDPPPGDTSAPASTPPGTAPDAATSGYDVAAIPPALGPPLRFLDACAGGVEGCPAGIEGTILAEGYAVPDPPMQILHDSYTADHGLTPDCAGDRRSFQGQAVIELVTNNPGTFVLHGAVEATMTTPDAATRRWRDNPRSRTPITTCVAVSMPPDILDYRVVATDVNGSVDTRRFSVQLESANTRPPLTITPGLTTLRIALPVMHNEESVVVVHNRDSGLDINPCRANAAVPVPAESRRLPFDTSTLSPEYDRRYTEQNVMTILATMVPHADICVLAIRTESVGVSYVSFAQTYRIDAPSTYRIDAEVTALKASHDQALTGPLRVELKRKPAMTPCLVDGDAHNYPPSNSGPRGNPMWGGIPLCQLLAGESEGFIDLAATFKDVRHEVAVAVPTRMCITTPAGSLLCPNQPLDQLVAVPLGDDGDVYVHLHLTPADDRRAEWSIGAAQDALTAPGTQPEARPRPPYANLDVPNTTVLAPEGPDGSSTLVITWNADRLATATAWVEDYDHSTCSRDVNLHVVTGPDVLVLFEAPNDHGTLTLTNLCAGTQYRLALELTDESGRVARYSMRSEDPNVKGDGLHGTTELKAVRYEASADFDHLPGAWDGLYVRRIYIAGGTEGNIEFADSRRDHREPDVHLPTNAWQWAKCGPAGELGTGSGVVSAKWPEDIDVSISLHVYASPTPCGGQVTDDEIAHAPASHFLRTSSFTRHVTPRLDHLPGPGVYESWGRWWYLTSPSVADLTMTFGLTAEAAG
jgi:hypothetical protein